MTNPQKCTLPQRQPDDTHEVPTAVHLPLCSQHERTARWVEWHGSMSRESTQGEDAFGADIEAEYPNFQAAYHYFISTFYPDGNECQECHQLRYSDSLSGKTCQTSEPSQASSLTEVEGILPLPDTKCFVETVQDLKITVKQQPEFLKKIPRQGVPPCVPVTEYTPPPSPSAFSTQFDDTVASQLSGSDNKSAEAQQSEQPEKLKRFIKKYLLIRKTIQAWQITCKCEVPQEKPTPLQGPALSHLKATFPRQTRPLAGQRNSQPTNRGEMEGKLDAGRQTPIQQPVEAENTQVAETAREVTVVLLPKQERPTLTISPCADSRVSTSLPQLMDRDSLMPSPIDQRSRSPSVYSDLSRTPTDEYISEDDMSVDEPWAAKDHMYHPFFPIFSDACKELHDTFGFAPPDLFEAKGHGNQKANESRSPAQSDQTKSGSSSRGLRSSGSSNSRKRAADNGDGADEHGDNDDEQDVKRRRTKEKGDEVPELTFSCPFLIKYPDWHHQRVCKTAKSSTSRVK
jgi:hypothetical protein